MKWLIIWWRVPILTVQSLITLDTKFGDMLHPSLERGSSLIGWDLGDEIRHWPLGAFNLVVKKYILVGETNPNNILDAVSYNVPWRFIFALGTERSVFDLFVFFVSSYCKFKHLTHQFNPFMSLNILSFTWYAVLVQIWWLNIYLFSLHLKPLTIKRAVQTVFNQSQMLLRIFIKVLCLPIHLYN